MHRCSVLIVDDDVVFCHAVMRFLHERCSDHVSAVAAAASGEEGLTKAGSLQPDIVLLDLILPDLNGQEVIPLLRKTAPLSRIIAMTHYRVDSYRQASLEAGADTFIYKASLNTTLPSTIRTINEQAYMLQK